MIKNIKFKIWNIKLTIINGENTICENYKSSTGYAETKSFSIDTDLLTTIILIPDMFYGFKDLPSLKFISSYSATTIYENYFTNNNNIFKLITDFNSEHYTINENIILSCTAYAEDIYGYLNVNLKNCDCNFQSGILQPEQTTFIISCDDSCEFQEIPFITYGGPVERSKNEWLSDYFTLNNGVYSITLKVIKDWYYKINAEAVKKSIILDKYGLISAYKLTFDDLRILASKRFVTPEYKPVQIENTTMLYNVNYEYIDTAKFIVALHKLNIPIITNEKQTVKFGIYDMNIECDCISEDLQILDFGNIFIEGIYNNAIDYEHTEINIYLPYIGLISLNTADTMNKIINLKYKINILDGNCLVLIYADNNLILSQSCNIADKIPYKMSDNEEIFTQLELNNNYLHNEQPFIITRTNKATQAENLPYHDTKFYSILGDLSGYTEATEINFNIVHDFITLSEIEDIKNLLANGVII